MSAAREGFTRKRVASLTLGERLRVLRQEHSTTLVQLSRSLRIKKSYLEALEKGDYANLPAKVYVRGFVQAYAHYFGLSERTLTAHFDKEYGIQSNVRSAEESKEGRIAERQSILPRYVITPRHFVVGTLALLVAAGGFFLYRQITSFAVEPRLVIESPRSGESFAQRQIVITGETEPNARIFVDDQEVQVDRNGKFEADANLSPGVNTLTVRTINQFEREKSETITVEGSFEPVTPRASTTPASIVVEGVPTLVTISVDGELVFSEVVTPENPQVFAIEEEIIIQAAQAQNVFVTIGEGDTEVLSPEAGFAERTFFADSSQNEESSSDRTSELQGEGIRLIPEVQGE